MQIGGETLISWLWRFSNLPGRLVCRISPHSTCTSPSGSYYRAAVATLLHQGLLVKDWSKHPEPGSTAQHPAKHGRPCTDMNISTSTPHSAGRWPVSSPSPPRCISAVGARAAAAAPLRSHTLFCKGMAAEASQREGEQQDWRAHREARDELLLALEGCPLGVEAAPGQLLLQLRHRQLGHGRYHHIQHGGVCLRRCRAICRRACCLHTPRRDVLPQPSSDCTPALANMGHVDCITCGSMHNGFNGAVAGGGPTMRAHCDTTLSSDGILEAKV